jgi:hypothetical protein
MKSATARAPQPGNEEGRPGTGRPSEFVSNDFNKDSVTALRLQHLKRRTGMTKGRANLFSGMIWEAAI